jgi:dihydroflavonol-4-reductase
MMVEGETILVTGGTGFLGRHLVGALCRRGYALRVLTRHPQRAAWLSRYPRVTIVEGDLQRPQTLRGLAQGCQAVVHAAGLFSMWSGAGDFYATNVQGTAELIEESLRASVERFVYVSTIAVVGKPIPGRVIDEQHPTDPQDDYQRSKLEAERRVLQAVERGLPAVVVRPGAFYGPLGNYAFNRLFFVDPMRGIIMQMDGGRYIIFPVYIQDVAEGIVLALMRGRVGEVYNLCGECLSHRAAFDIVTREAGLWFPRLNIPRAVGIQFARLLTSLSRWTRREPFYPIGLRSYVFNDWIVSSAKAAHELGFQPTPFEEGVRRTIAWYRAGRPLDIAEVRCDS